MSEGLLTSFQQGVYEQSVTKKHRLGTLRINADGTKYRYARSGEALTAGNVACAPPAVAGQDAELVAAAGACAVGTTEITFTSAATAITANQYDDGLLIIYDGAAGTVGHKYRISGHTTAAGAGTITVKLRDPIRVALIATDTWSLVPSPWNGTLEQAAVANMFAGVSPIAVTSGYYYWAQTGGECVFLDKGGITLGGCLEISATSGSFKVAANWLGGCCGQVYAVATTDTKYGSGFLTHD
jgi:hypothetical protein